MTFLIIEEILLHPALLNILLCRIKFWNLISWGECEHPMIFSHLHGGHTATVGIGRKTVMLVCFPHRHAEVFRGRFQRLFLARAKLEIFNSQTLLRQFLERVTQGLDLADQGLLPLQGLESEKLLGKQPLPELVL